MTITMVKKRLENGNFCEKCIEMEQLLEKRGLLNRIDRFVIAEENDPQSPGMELALKHDVKTAPFFIVEREEGKEKIYTSTLQLIRKEMTEQQGKAPDASRQSSSGDVHTEFADLDNSEPEDIIRRALNYFGSDCAIAFSGAEDVVLIDMASKSGLPFSVFSLDTGRLHSGTYRFIEKVREHYAVDIRLVSPDYTLLEPFIREKGLFSFYRDGHKECCGIRKVEPLKRTLAGYHAWMTGQRRDQNPSTRGSVPVFQEDGVFEGKNGGLLCKFNPLSGWTLQQVWDYIRKNSVPFNELHDRGFISIGCEPCTRAVQPGEHERAGRWWWEEETKRECGLHVSAC